MNRNLFLILSLLIRSTLMAQNNPLPVELKPFILPKHEMLDFATGDLNGDKKPDAILVLKDPNEDSLMDDQPARPLLILLRQADGKLRQVVRNDSAMMGRHDGGAFGDPYEGIAISNNAFTINFYGGSAWRWTYEYRFSWKSLKKSWYLDLESQSYFHSGDPEKTMKAIKITESELGEVAFDKFSPGMFYQRGDWKVKAVKTYFYTSPQLGSKPRKAYLVKGNQVLATRELKNFIEVSFENLKGEITDGYILRKDLEPIK